MVVIESNSDKLARACKYACSWCAHTFKPSTHSTDTSWNHIRKIVQSLRTVFPCQEAGRTLDDIHVLSASGIFNNLIMAVM